MYTFRTELGPRIVRIKKAIIDSRGMKLLGVLPGTEMSIGLDNMLPAFADFIVATGTKSKVHRVVLNLMNKEDTTEKLQGVQQTGHVVRQRKETKCMKM